MYPAEAYRRWRHSHGFGVHSPFAYDLVRHVVHPPKGYVWYGYTDIDNDILHDRTSRRLPHVRRHARMLLRLAAWLNVDSAYLPKDSPATPFRAALRAANSRMRVTSAQAEIGKCTLVASTGDFIPLSTLLSLVATPGRIIGMRDVPQGWAAALFEALPEGVMLHSPHSLILVHRPGMQKTSYSIIL